MFETSIDVAAAPADVWAVLIDVERWPEWTASMSDVKVLGDGPLAVGVRVTVALAITRSGPAAPIVDALFARLTRRYVVMEAEGLKRRCEGGAA